MKAYIIFGSSTDVAWRPAGVQTEYHKSVVVRSKQAVLDFMEATKRPGYKIADHHKTVVGRWLDTPDAEDNKEFWVMFSLGADNYDSFMISPTELKDA